MTEEPIKLILMKFGTLKSFHLVKDHPIYSKGYAFCEYLDQNSTDLAVKELNGFMIEGKPLILKLAGTPAPLDTLDKSRSTYD